MRSARLSTPSIVDGIGTHGYLSLDPLATSIRHATPMSDNRRHPRYSINREFESIGELVDEYVNNISRSGVFIRSRNPLPVGTEVDLKFTVILDDFETVEGVGRVVRVIPDGEDAGMGVEFTEMSAESRRVIEEVADRTNRDRHGS